MLRFDLHDEVMFQMRLLAHTYDLAMLQRYFINGIDYTRGTPSFLGFRHGPDSLVCRSLSALIFRAQNGLRISPTSVL